MIEKSLAQPKGFPPAPPANAPRELTREPEPQPAYVLRGLGLFELYRDGLLAGYQGGGRWLIPSGGTEPDTLYEVRVGSPGCPERNRCECVGYQRHGHCSHVVCASVARKKSGLCDCCGERRWWPELTEVEEDDELLARCRRVVSAKRSSIFSCSAFARRCRRSIRASIWAEARSTSTLRTPLVIVE